jgi:hypothetical protein
VDTKFVERELAQLAEAAPNGGRAATDAGAGATA